MNQLSFWIDNLLANAGYTSGDIPYLRLLIMSIGLIILSLICFYITKYLIIHTIYRFIKRTPFKWDDLIVEYKTFDNLAHLIPAFIIKGSISLILQDFEHLLPFFTKLTDIYIVIVFMIIFLSFLKVIENSISRSPAFENKPIASYFQMFRIIIYIIVAILIISIIINKSPLYLLSAFGALSAILLLVFKDTILGLVASVQISSNDMVRIGDWIEMPKFNADGEVTAINLNTVKVENWDKTITTIPTYYFITDSFKNWRGMQESGGRRINRSIFINVRSIKFVEKSDLVRYKKYQILKDFIEQRQNEIDTYNATNNIDISEAINGRHMTNIGVFRRYIELYLMNHPHIRKDMTLLIRQLSIDERGIPINIYCFTATTQWSNYEDIQANIFDHLLAAARFFDIEIYQQPGGDDMNRIASSLHKSK